LCYRKLEEADAKHVELQRIKAEAAQKVAAAKAEESEAALREAELKLKRAPKKSRQGLIELRRQMQDQHNVAQKAKKAADELALRRFKDKYKAINMARSNKKAATVDNWLELRRADQEAIQERQLVELYLIEEEQTKDGPPKAVPKAAENAMTWEERKQIADAKACEEEEAAQRLRLATEKHKADMVMYAVKAKEEQKTEKQAFSEQVRRAQEAKQASANPAVQEMALAFQSASEKLHRENFAGSPKDKPGWQRKMEAEGRGGQIRKVGQVTTWLTKMHKSQDVYAKRVKYAEDAEVARLKRIQDKIDAEREKAEAEEAGRLHAESEARLVNEKAAVDRVEAARLKVINDAKMKELRAPKEAFKRAAILKRTGVDIDEQKKRFASRERSRQRHQGAELELEKLRFEAYLEENWQSVKVEASERDTEIYPEGRPCSVMKMNLNWDMVDEDVSLPAAAAEVLEVKSKVKSKVKKGGVNSTKEKEEKADEEEEGEEGEEGSLRDVKPESRFEKMKRLKDIDSLESILKESEKRELEIREKSFELWKIWTGLDEDSRMIEHELKLAHKEAVEAEGEVDGIQARWEKRVVGLTIGEGKAREEKEEWREKLGKLQKEVEGIKVEKKQCWERLNETGMAKAEWTEKLQAMEEQRSRYYPLHTLFVAEYQLLSKAVENKAPYDLARLKPLLVHERMLMVEDGKDPVSAEVGDGVLDAGLYPELRLRKLKQKLDNNYNPIAQALQQISLTHNYSREHKEDELEKAEAHLTARTKMMHEVSRSFDLACAHLFHAVDLRERAEDGGEQAIKQALERIKDAQARVVELDGMVATREAKVIPAKEKQQEVERGIAVETSKQKECKKKIVVLEAKGERCAAALKLMEDERRRFEKEKAREKERRDKEMQQRQQKDNFQGMDELIAIQIKEAAAAALQEKREADAELAEHQAKLDAEAALRLQIRRDRMREEKLKENNEKRDKEVAAIRERAAATRRRNAEFESRMVGTGMNERGEYAAQMKIAVEKERDRQQQEVLQVKAAGRMTYPEAVPKVFRGAVERGKWKEVEQVDEKTREWLRSLSIGAGGSMADYEKEIASVGVRHLADVIQITQQQISTVLFEKRHQRAFLKGAQKLSGTFLDDERVPKTINRPEIEYISDKSFHIPMPDAQRAEAMGRPGRATVPPMRGAPVVSRFPPLRPGSEAGMNTYLKIKKRGVVAAAMSSIVTEDGFQAVASHQLLVSAADGTQPGNRPFEMGAKDGSQPPRVVSFATFKAPRRHLPI